MKKEKRSSRSVGPKMLSLVMFWFRKCNNNLIASLALFLQSLQAPDHIPLHKEISNGTVSKFFSADQGDEELANLSGGEGV